MPNLRSLLATVSLLFFLLTPASAFESNYNLEDGFNPVEHATQKHPEQKIEGELAIPFEDDSHWADVEVKYSELTNNPGEGASSQRVEVARVSSGMRVQIAYREFPLVFGEEIVVNLMAKSDDYTPIQLRVGQKKPPYKTLWNRSVGLSAEWSKIESIIPGNMDEQDAHFMIVIEQPGTVDFDQLHILRRESKALSLSDERKGNLLPGSSFPLGARTAPWIMDNLHRIDVGDEAGPTGSMPLRFEILDRGGAPFSKSLKVSYNGLPNQPHVVSVHARVVEGNARMALRTGPPTEKLWEDPYQGQYMLAPEWERYTHSLNLPPSNDGYYILQVAFEGEGTIEVDGVQVEQADDSPDFKRTGKTEVSLRPAVPFGLAVGDEPLRYEVTVFGEIPEGAVLKTTLHDVYGKAYDLGMRPLTTDPYVVHEVAIPDDGLPARGTFRLEAVVQNQAGEAISLPADVLLHRVAKPRFAGRLAADSPFAMHLSPGQLKADEVAVVKNLGFNSLRLFTTFDWKRVQPEDGELRHAEIESDLELLARNHLTALAILGNGAPRWAADDPDPSFRGWALWTPRNPEDFTNYAAQIFEKYGDVIKDYEVWNEPYYAGFFTQEIKNGNQRIIGSANRYYELHKGVWEKAQEAGKGIRIFWNTNTMAEMPRTQELVNLGILDNTDAVTLHHYLGRTNPGLELQKQITAMQEILREHKKDIPLWNSEGGAGPSTVFNFYNNVPPVQTIEHHQLWAHWYCEYYLQSMLGGVERFYAYLMGSTNFWRKDYHFSNVDGSLSPNLIAMSNMAWQIDGTRFVKKIKLGEAVDAYLFAGEGRSVAMLESDRVDGGYGVPRSKDLESYDLFGNRLAGGARVGTTFCYVQSTLPIDKFEAEIRRAPIDNSLDEGRAGMAP